MHTIQIVEDYEICAEQIKLSNDQKPSFWSVSFLFLSASFSLITTEWQTACWHHGQWVWFWRPSSEQTFVLADSCYWRTNRIHWHYWHPTGLTKTVTHINTLTPRCPPDLRLYRNKTRFLRHAFLSQHSIETVICNITTSKNSFNAFVAALCQKILFELEEKSCSLSFTSTALY